VLLAFYCQEEGQKLLCHIKYLFSASIFWFQLLNFLRLFHIAVHMLSCKLHFSVCFHVLSCNLLHDHPLSSSISPLSWSSRLSSWESETNSGRSIWVKCVNNVTRPWSIKGLHSKKKFQFFESKTTASVEAKKQRFCALTTFNRFVKFALHSRQKLTLQTFPLKAINDGLIKSELLWFLLCIAPLIPCFGNVVEVDGVPKFLLNSVSWWLKPLHTFCTGHIFEK